MKLGALALPRRVPLAVVARDASNPSTGLFAKQQVCQGWESNPQNSGSKPDTYSIRLLWQAGRLGLEPRPTVLETAMLPLHHQPSPSFVVT